MSEAPYVLDGLHQHVHQTDLRIAEHYTDTAGATDHVFGLCNLLGFRFAPRIKDLKDRKLYAIEKPGTYPLLEPLIGDTVETSALVNQWAVLMRLKPQSRLGRSCPPSSCASSPRPEPATLCLAPCGHWAGLSARCSPCNGCRIPTCVSVAMPIQLGRRKELSMKSILMPAALTLALAAWLTPAPVQAAGCLKGAALGGVAGHVGCWCRLYHWAPRGKQAA
jgi:Tn3 transposase DDE domain